MQTIYLDLAQKNALQHIYAKQGDVGRCFKAVILDNGEPYSIERGTVFTVWYNGTSGEGNYSSVGEKSAITFAENVLQVELISQMLASHGGGTLCIEMHNADGTQIGLWNLLYFCEAVPGMGSAEATSHYTALSEVAQQAISAATTFKTDENLKLSGVAADAKAVGDELEKKAPAGYGLGEELLDATAFVSNLNSANLKTGFYRCSAATANCPDDAFGGGPLLAINWHNNALCGQLLFNNDLTQAYFRSYKDGVWQPWNYLNPPMKTGVEYATMERNNDKIVYTKLVYCGTCSNGLQKSIGSNLQVIRYSGYVGSVAVPAMIGAPNSATLYANFYVNGSVIQVSCSNSTELSGKPVYCRIWYTKE